MQRLIAFLILSFVLRAQTPIETAFYAVAYVEVMPASRTAALTAFRQYRDASSKEDGFSRFELFEEVSRPGHFVILERWSNAKALEAHSAAAHTKEYRAKLDPIRLGDYDQRPYKPLALGPTTVASNRAVYVVSHVDIGGQGTNAPDLLRKLAEDSRTHDGNVRFDVLQHNVRANHFTVIEGWQNEKALDAHISASSTRAFRNAVGPLTGSPLDQRAVKFVE